MSSRVYITLCVSMVLAAGLAPTDAWAQRPKDINWTHAFDLACRKFGENEFTKDTQKFGVEAFKDTNNNLGIYLSEKGSIAVAPGFAELKPAEKSKGPEWLTGLDLPARKAGEKEFGKDTKVHSMEVFKDVNTNNWVYITEKGLIAAGPMKFKTVSAIVGTEAAPETVKDAGKAPEWLHGLDLACRKFDEPNFTKDTKRYGVEVFRDENNGNLIFVCETGNIAVTTGRKDIKAPTPSVKQPVWQHGLNLKARRFGETEFSAKTRVWGGEVFRDENVGVILYVLENGSISGITTP